MAVDPETILVISCDPNVPPEDAETIVELTPEQSQAHHDSLPPDPRPSATFAAAEDQERLRLVNERARTDPAYAALAELTLGKDQPR
jgi:hypothetical protein